MKQNWQFPSRLDSKLVEELAENLKLPPPLAAILIQRGYDSVEKAKHFLEPRLADLETPEKIPGITEAVKRLKEALFKKEKIVLYGDYDVDGITSLALLTRLLRALGGHVSYFIPERMSEGYGLSRAGIQRCIEITQPELLLAIDCGTNSLAEAQWIKNQGIDLLIIDHHQLATVTAQEACEALVNPQFGTEYHYLCSVGLAFKLAHALLKTYPERPVDLRHYLDLVALGTVADIMPLVGENRSLVARGLRQLTVSQWAGVKALIDIAEVKTPITAFDIGYKLGPRLNAAGRLSSALESLELLLTDDPSQARDYASHLDRRNRERQRIEREVTLEAEEMAEVLLKTRSPKGLVLGRLHWHQGVVGIVASRISKRWHRPTLIIGFDEEGKGKGSGRSIEGFSLVKALQESSHLLEAFGGHAMAAGITLPHSKLEKFQQAFEKTAAAFLKEEDLIPCLKIDAEVTLEELDYCWWEAQERLAPFGVANPQPLLLARSLTPVKAPRILKEKHLRLEFQGAKGVLISAIFFNGATYSLPPPPWDVAFTLERNSYQGRCSLQMNVMAFNLKT